jgi:hypothetical protein
MTTAQRASFEYAADRLGRMITTKHAIIAPPDSSRCEPAKNEQLPSTIEDLFIFVRITSIDGVSGVLGQAGPCLMDRNGFPRVGYVEFDLADVEKMIKDQTFDAVCVHEIMHIIGIGTLWDSKRLVGGTAADPRYMGRNGINALPTIKAEFMGTPAIQDKGGEGTEGSHWRDSAFGDEMMTAYLSASYQPVSALTVESFKDLGYSVDSSSADLFNVSASGYTTPNVPYNESPTRPTWYDFDSVSGFWTSTTIWIIACAGGVALVLILSCIYTKLKRRKTKRPTNPPMPMSSAHQPSLSTTSMRIPPAPQYPQSAVPQAVYMPTSSYANPPPRAFQQIPVAYPIATPSGGQRQSSDTVSDHNVGMFMEITNCNDMTLATRYMREANGNVSLAVDRYMQTGNRPMAVV